MRKVFKVLTNLFSINLPHRSHDPNDTFQPKALSPRMPGLTLPANCLPPYLPCHLSTGQKNHQALLNASPSIISSHFFQKSPQTPSFGSGKCPKYTQPIPQNHSLSLFLAPQTTANFSPLSEHFCLPFQHVTHSLLPPHLDLWQFKLHHTPQSEHQPREPIMPVSANTFWNVFIMACVITEVII